VYVTHEQQQNSSESIRNEDGKYMIFVKT